MCRRPRSGETGFLRQHLLTTTSTQQRQYVLCAHVSTSIHAGADFLTRSCSRGLLRAGTLASTGSPYLRMPPVRGQCPHVLRRLPTTHNTAILLSARTWYGSHNKSHSMFGRGASWHEQIAGHRHATTEQQVHPRMRRRRGTAPVLCLDAGAAGRQC